MGEAKRKNKHAQLAEESLLRRIREGEFGEAGTMSQACVVIDKSPRGAAALKALRALPETSALKPLLESLELQLWEASAIFRFALLVSDAEGGKGQVLLAADMEKLDQQLSRALAHKPGQGKSRGLLIAVEDDVDGVIHAKARQLQPS